MSEWCGKACFRGASTTHGRKLDIIALLHVQSAGAALLYHQTTFAIQSIARSRRSTIFVRALNQKRFIVPSKSVTATLAGGQQIKSSRFACKQSRRVTKAKGFSRRQTKAAETSLSSRKEAASSGSNGKTLSRENQFLLGACRLKCH